MTASKTTKKAVAKNTSKASKVATKAPKKKAPAKKTTAKKTTVKKAPVKAVKQEKEMTKALAVVEPVKTEPVKETPVETVKAEPKAKKKIKTCGVIRHVRSKSRGDKTQNRLKGTAEGKNQWGHKLGSQAAKIDHLIESGRFSMSEIQAMSGAGTKGRLYNHFRALKEKGFPVHNEKGKVKFA